MKTTFFDGQVANNHFHKLYLFKTHSQEYCLYLWGRFGINILMYILVILLLNASGKGSGNNDFNVWGQFASGSIRVAKL